MKPDVLVLSLAFLCSMVAYSDACSCLPAHPQEQYCHSDFVILARVKRERILNGTKVYKVRVRKEYKISEKGLLALKSGRINTALDSAMCGVDLEPGKLYVLSGHIYSLKAYINLCNMATPWEHFTKRQRKGLRRLYRHGCLCQIKPCFPQAGRKCYRQADSCNWNNDCETKEGVCLRQANRSCMWTRNKALTQCTKEWKSQLFQLQAMSRDNLTQHRTHLRNSSQPLHGSSY